MMTEDVFRQFASFAVAEPVVASAEAPMGLNPSEQVLFKVLLKEARGRLEQEFLPAEFTGKTILNWANEHSDEFSF